MAIRFLVYGVSSMALSLHRSLWFVRICRKFCHALISVLQVLAFSLLVSVVLVVLVVLI